MGLMMLGTLAYSKPVVPEPSAFQVEIAIGNLRRKISKY